MTGADAAARLLIHGLDPSEESAKAALFDLVLQHVRGGTPPRLWWVPGRLEVFGKHTDYAGGRTLVSALPRGFAVAAVRRRDDTIAVVDARSGERVALAPEALDATIAGWGNYVQTAARRLTRNFAAARAGADIVFASDLPQAAGMSSSSALIVSMATVLVQLRFIDRTDRWRQNIRSSLDAAGYFACIENGMSFGTLEGDRGVGTHGGSEDHAAMLAGTAGHLSAFAFTPMRRIGCAPLAAGWAFVIAPSGVAAEKTGAARGLYNRLSEGTGRLLALWNDAEPRASSLAAALSSSEDAVARLRSVVAHSDVNGWPPDALERRLDHFLREDARVPAALHAFAAADAEALAEVADASQRDAEDLLGNQVPETIALARSARALGAIGACSFGAGFGGSVWALVDRDMATSFAARWHSQAFIASPGPPLIEI
jgi:galactokinase